MALVGHRVRSLTVDAFVQFDAHLLPGDSTSVLRDSMSVGITEIHDDRAPVDRTRNITNATAPPNPAIAMRFEGGFRGSDAAPNHALGVTFDPATGTTRADMVLPAPNDRVQNFTMRAIATAHNGAEETHAEAWVRVHVHGSLRRIWLTPNPMTLHRDARAFTRLTALGEFDDGVVADLTQFERTVPDWETRFTWETDNDTVARIAPNGRIEARAEGHATITCRIMQPGALPDAVATAGVDVVAPWNAGAEIKLVAGDADRRANVPNILFLAEGFERDDENPFDEIVQTLVNRLAKNHLIDPWPMLHKSVNFWSAFVPGSAAGMTRHLEIWLEEDNGTERRMYSLPKAKRPADNATAWSINEMIHMIGLPVPDDADVGLDDMLPRLRARFGDQVTKARIESRYSQWMQYARRTYMNDVNSAFRLAKGRRTRAKVSDDDDDSIFDLDDRRIQNGDLRDFLGGMRLGGNQVPFWGEHGKDRALVCMLTRSSGRSVASDDFFVCSLAHRTFDSAELAGGTGMRVSPIELPDPQSEDLDWLTYLFAHECGHAFSLGDEYGESDIDKTSTFASTQDDEAPFIERFPNLTAMATLRVGTSQEIDAGRVKWGQWLRIADAGVLDGAPTVAGTRATVRIRDGQARRFAVDDHVRLRKRLCRRNADNELGYRAFITSGRLKVVGRPDTDTVVVEAEAPLELGEAVFADFNVIFAAGEGSFLFKPTRQKMPGNIDPVEVPVMSPLLTSHLSTKDRPLNVSGDGGYACQLDFRAVQQPKNLPVLPTNKPCYEPLIIGLYDGGRRNHCGTFHPGGICMMRDEHVNSDHRRFCTVCRYVLVDMIDPTFHGALDKVYAKEYPH
jgi:hypothetical protein